MEKIFFNSGHRLNYFYEYDSSHIYSDMMSSNKLSLGCGILKANLINHVVK